MARDSHLRLLAVQLLLELSLLTLELLRGDRLVNLGSKGVLRGQTLLRRVVLLAIVVFLHAAGHAGAAVADLCLLVDALLPFLFLFFHLFLVDEDGAGFRDWVGLEGGSAALGVQIVEIALTARLLHHLRFVAQPEREWSLALLGNLD